MVLHSGRIGLIVIKHRSVTVDQSHSFSRFGKLCKTFLAVFFHRKGQVGGFLFQFLLQSLSEMSVKKSQDQPDADHQNHRRHGKDGAKDTLRHFFTPPYSLLLCTPVME